MKKNLSNSKPKRGGAKEEQQQNTSNKSELQNPDVEILKEVAEELGKENPLVQKIAVAIHKRSYEGSIPQAEEMAKYETIMTGATSRIIGMAELHGNSSSQIALQDSETRTKESKRGFILMLVGIIFAFIIALVFLGLAFYLIVNDKTFEGLGTILVGIIAIFALALKSKIDMSFLGMKFNSKEK